MSASQKSPMHTLKVEVTDEHLAKVSRTKPMEALLELIWNALDGDATTVVIAFETALIDTGGIERITVSDNGTGISIEDANLFFGRLGQSWKKIAGYSRKDKRVLHGKEGEGRFKAFSLGGKVAWRSTYKTNCPGPFGIIEKRVRNSRKMCSRSEIYDHAARR